MSLPHVKAQPNSSFQLEAADPYTGSYAQKVPRLSKDEWQLMAQDIQIAKNVDGSDRVLGSGGFGTVRSIPTY